MDHQPTEQLSPSPTNEITDPIVASKIEVLIQQYESVSIPAIVFEYISKDSSDFDYNDLKNFFSQFGTIDSFDLKGKTSIVLFKTFFSANVCRVFLSNENNFKDNMKNNFTVRWFKLEKDDYLLSDELKQKYTLISQQNISNSSTNNIPHKKLSMSTQNVQQQQMQLMQNQFIPNMQMNMNVIPNIGKTQNTKMNMNYYPNQNYMMHMHMQGKNGQNGNNINTMGQNINNYYNGNGNQQNSNMIQQQSISNGNNNQNGSNIYEEKSTYGKFTCKFEILIPNDQEFQVVRRLIGSKGCNMKKIVDSCKGQNDIGQGNVKLRLRGKGSGYKEGPQNKESDDPLHLCISAKNQESLKKACGLVGELIGKIYEEYKKHCHKTGVPPLPKIANKIDGGNTIHIKNNNGNNNNNQGLPMNIGMNANIGMNPMNMNIGNHY